MSINETELVFYPILIHLKKKRVRSKYRSITWRYGCYSSCSNIFPSILCHWMIECHHFNTILSIFSLCSKHFYCIKTYCKVRACNKNIGNVPLVIVAISFPSWVYLNFGSSKWGKEDFGAGGKTGGSQSRGLWYEFKVGSARILTQSKRGSSKSNQT